VSDLLLVNLASTLFLTGLVWFLQVVHLPVFFTVDHGDFARAVARHRRRNTLLMAGPMLAEIYTATRLAWSKTPLDGAALTSDMLNWALGLLAIIWIVTFAWHMPQYRRLGSGYDEPAIRGLILSNWVRTACWTGRSAIMLWIAFGRLRI